MRISKAQLIVIITFVYSNTLWTNHTHISNRKKGQTVTECPLFFISLKLFVGSKAKLYCTFWNICQFLSILFTYIDKYLSFFLCSR